MFYYYGRKKKIAHLYPDPIFDLIIEPFAGSAAYSLHGSRWENDVRLYDIDPLVVSMWDYLLLATKKDILNLPDVKFGDDIRDIHYISDVERCIIGFAINPGSSRPRNIVTRYSRWKANKLYIASNIHKIKHWKVYLGSYLDIQDEKCTWFIDPPYMCMGIHYHKNTIDYNELGKWILSRRGQITACEGIGADYLPFRELCEFKAIGKRVSKEMVFLGAG